MTSFISSATLTSTSNNSLETGGNFTVAYCKPLHTGGLGTRLQNADLIINSREAEPLSSSIKSKSDRPAQISQLVTGK